VKNSRFSKVATNVMTAVTKLGAARWESDKKELFKESPGSIKVIYNLPCFILETYLFFKTVLRLCNSLFSLNI
jgi:hypothetical protein